jgi:plasmid maintenance system antidote protein VapI
VPAPDRISALVRHYLRAHFANADMWQYQLAEQVGISPKHLSGIIHGHVGVTPQMAERLLTAIGLRLVLGVEPLDYNESERT